jgi:soluble epoxide hydrolase/lipid-phosphate phosphatase
VSRLANYYSKFFAGFAFVSFGYFPPSPEFDIHQALETSKKVFGYELFGYWPFMARDDAYEVIEAHVRMTWFVMHT